jgi:hypothetical protein
MRSTESSTRDIRTANDRQLLATVTKKLPLPYVYAQDFNLAAASSISTANANDQSFTKPH